MVFWKVIYENIEKKAFISQQTYTSHRHFEVWHFVHTLVSYSRYAYILPYMQKTLPSLRNEKERQTTKFYEKSLGDFIFLRETKNVLFHSPERASAQKVRLHHWQVFYFIISPQVQNSDIEKCILMSASDNIMLEIFLNGCFSQTDAKMVFILEILRVTHILDSCDTMLKRNMFLWIFLKVLVKSVSTWH